MDGDGAGHHGDLHIVVARREQSPQKARDNAVGVVEPRDVVDAHAQEVVANNERVAGPDSRAGVRF